MDEATSPARLVRTYTISHFKLLIADRYSRSRSRQRLDGFAKAVADLVRDWKDYWRAVQSLGDFGYAGLVADLATDWKLL